MSIAVACEMSLDQYEAHEAHIDSQPNLFAGITNDQRVLVYDADTEGASHA